MLKIYGSMLCKDCVQCREDLDRAGVAYKFYDFSEDLPALKEFLAIRDREPVSMKSAAAEGSGSPASSMNRGG